MVTQEELQKMSPEQIAELQKQNCIFCKINKGEIPSKTVYKDDEFFAVLDINPAQKGHTLLLPKEHIPILPLLPKNSFEKLMLTTKKLSQAIEEGTMSKGTQVFIANGAAAGQQSPHFLLHIIPYDNSLHINIPEKSVEGQEELLEKLKQRLGVPKQQLQEEKPGNQQELLATFLQTNHEARKIIIENPEQALQLIQKDEEARKLFQGIDLYKLSQQLRRSTQ